MSRVCHKGILATLRRDKVDDLLQKSTAKETHAHAQSSGQPPSKQHKRARGTCKKCSKKIGDAVYGAGGRYTTY